MKIKKVLTVVLVLAACIGGFYFWLNTEKTDTLQQDAEILKTDTAPKNNFYLSEDSYEEERMGEVKSYLEPYKKEGYYIPEKNVKLHYCTYIPKNVQASIVISHGFTEFAEKYEEIIYYFLKKNYAVYIMEDRGHGYSTRGVNNSSIMYVKKFDDYVNDFIGFVEKVVHKDGKPCYLYAHSMGGCIGVRAMEEKPGLFDKAVLSSPMLKVKTGYTMRMTKFLTEFMILLGQGKKYAFGQHAYQKVGAFEKSSLTSKARYEYMKKLTQENPKYQTRGASFSWVHSSVDGCQKALKQKNLKKITVPVLVFQAEKDDMVKVDGMFTFVNQIASSKFIYVPDAKHEIMGSKNEIMIPYFEQIFNFLDV